MSAPSHSGAASAVGYLYQSRWALLELLRVGKDRPERRISIELFDDVAWDADGTPTEKLQIKHHQRTVRAFSDGSVDLWRTVQAWMDTGDPTDPDGPLLLLVSTQTASSGSALHALRAKSRDTQFAREKLEEAASTLKGKETKDFRANFLNLGVAGRTAFLGRVYVADGAPYIKEIDALVKRELLWGAPSGNEDLYLDLVWRWWDNQALAMLLGDSAGLTAQNAGVAIAEIRDGFTSETLPPVVPLSAISVKAQADLVAEMAKRRFVVHLQGINWPRVNLQKAIVDYYRAVAATTVWLDNGLLGAHELEEFEAKLHDEWQREFEFMCLDLPEDADEAAKRAAGRRLLRSLLDSTSVNVRPKYTDAYLARGSRHSMADRDVIGWHPAFTAQVEELLVGTT